MSATAKKNTVTLTIIGLIFFGIVFFLVRASQRPSDSAQTNKIKVTTSFYPLYFFTQQIGGDKANIVNITPAGAEPHDYEPTALDVARIEGSKLLVLNGGGLEAWGNDIQKNIDPKKTAMVVAGEGLADQQATGDRQTTAADPHFWLDPPLAEKMTEKITRGFEEVDPANKSYYESNAAALQSKLIELDAAYREGLSNCGKKSIVTSHAAFGYLANTYGFNQISIAGLSPNAEPSPQRLADVAKFAKDNDVQYIFFESLVSPKLSQTIATEIGARTLVLNPIEGLSDEELKQGKNYFTEMRNNLANLRIALQCEK